MFCTNCGKEMADDSRFCTVCGGSPAGDSPKGEPSAGAKRPKIRVPWIVIAVVALVAAFAIVRDKRSPKATAERETPKPERVAEGKPDVTLSDFVKSYHEIKQAGEELDKSIGDMKDAWQEAKRQVREAAQEAAKDPSGERIRSESAAASTNEMTLADAVKSYREINQAKKELDKSLEDMKSEWENAKRQIGEAVEASAKASLDAMIRETPELNELNTEAERMKELLDSDEWKDARKALEAALDEME